MDADFLIPNLKIKIAEKMSANTTSLTLSEFAKGSLTNLGSVSEKVLLLTYY